MSETASYVPTTTWRGRLWGIVAIVVPSAGAIGAAMTDQPYAALLVVLAVVIFAGIGGVLASTTSRFVLSTDERALYVDEHRWITKTRRSVIRLDGPTRPELATEAASLVLREGHERVLLKDVPPALIGDFARRIESTFATWTPPPPPPEPDPHKQVLDETRGLLVMLLHRDEDGVRHALAQGADPNGHPEAGGRGAPLRIARLLDFVAAEAMLRKRGATPVETAIDPKEWGLVVLVAQVEGLTDVVKRLQEAAEGSVAHHDAVVRRAPD